MDTIPYTPPSENEVAPYRAAIEAHKARQNERDGAKRQ